MSPKYSAVFFSVGMILVLMLFLIGVPMGMLPESQHDNDDKEQLVTNKKIIPPKPIDQMDCTELNEFITSFEKGWGTAITLYNEKCL